MKKIQPRFHNFMQLHQLKPIHKFKKSKRIGRGGKHGTYCGKGIKGQNSRAGSSIRPALRDLIKKIPKLRGYRYKRKDKKIVEINLGILEKQLEAGEKITPMALLKKGMIQKIKGALPEVKLLGDGSLTKKLLVEKCKVSKKAKEKIEAAGGKVIGKS